MKSDETDGGVSIVIPCYNEAATITRAVESALEGLKTANLKGEIIVADNGSTDASGDLASRAGARVEKVSLKGYGSALHSGILAAKFQWVVFADADLSYPFEEVGKLIEPLKNGTADFVLGNRLTNQIETGAMPYLNRYLGTPILSFLIQHFYGLPASDCNSGMRAFSKSCYVSLGLVCPGMEYASEMLIRISQKKLTYLEVPISFRKDKRGHPPHLKRWRDGWRHLRFILANAPSKKIVLFPFISGLGLLSAAFIFSLQSYWWRDEPLHFHTAFAAIALSTPLLMFSVSLILVKLVLHQTGHETGQLVRYVEEFSEKNYPFVLSALSYLAAFAQLLIMVFLWAKAGWSNLFEISGVIRIMIFTIFGSILISLDIGYGIIKLIPVTKKNEL